MSLAKMFQNAIAETGMLEWWNDGMLEWWNDGMME
jgi:hypothetical protein